MGQQKRRARAVGVARCTAFAPPNEKKASVQSMDRWTSNHATLNGNGCEESLFAKRTRDERESDRD
jgi:hypothetical protein